MGDPAAIREPFIDLIEKEEPILGRYLNVERLGTTGGSGHFSLVFKAFDAQSGKDVVLKFFSPFAMYDSYRLACFDRECEILEALRGADGIVQLVEGRQVLTVELLHQATDFPVPLQIPFFAMERADSSVRQWLYNGDPDPITALEYFHQMCRAVQRIHLSNLCHRDLKPSNYLIFGPSQIALTDFGTARYLGDSSPPLRPIYEMPVGDLRYASPELFLGVEGDNTVQMAADIFALGAILFELFTKVVLTGQVFDFGYRRAMRAVGLSVQRLGDDEREHLRRDVIAGIAASGRLPSIADYESAAPASIRSYIDDIYQRLCCLDYRKRWGLRHFPRIFLRIAICRLILVNEAKYQGWLAEKRRRQQRRAQRQDDVRRHWQEEAS